MDNDTLRNELARVTAERDALVEMAQSPERGLLGHAMDKAQLRAEVLRLRAELDQTLAANLALAAGMGRTVKPLVWTKHPTAKIWRCDTMLGTYKVFSFEKVSWDFDALGEGGQELISHVTDNDVAAFAATQADYEARILSALVPAPVTVAEAAKVLLEYAKTHWIWTPPDAPVLAKSLLDDLAGETK